MDPSARHDEVLWVQEYLAMGDGFVAYKRLILSHHKNLNRGGFLVDKRNCASAGCDGVGQT